MNVQCAGRHDMSELHGCDHGPRRREGLPSGRGLRQQNVLPAVDGQQGSCIYIWYCECIYIALRYVMGAGRTSTNPDALRFLLQ